MLSGLEPRTSWALAEHAGEVTPDRMQRLFTTAKRDEDLVRDDLRGYVAAALGDPGGVLIGDGTGFEKKGDRSAELPGRGVPGLRLAQGPRPG